MNLIAQTTQQAAQLLITSRAFWLPVVSAVISALIIDLQSYLAAKDGEPFLWRKTVVRVVIALLTGASIGLGVNSVPPQ